MSVHTKAIVLFGVAVPGILLLVLIVVTYSVLTNLQEQKEQKTVAYRSHEQTVAQINALEAQLSGKRDLMAYWEENLNQEFIQSLTQNLSEIDERFSDKQLRQTALSRPGTRSPLAGYTENEYSRFRMSFIGGFGPMQEAFAELELRMPHLVLESMKMRTVNTTGDEDPSLEFDVTYLCWQEKK